MGKKGGLLTILTGVVIVGCSLVNSCTHNSRILVPKKQITQESFQTLETKLIPFRVYYPPSKPKIKIKDSLLEVAVTESYSPNELSLLVSNPNYSDNFKDEHLGKIEIKDYEKFRSGVLDVAGKFGYSEENIIRASIHDLIMLSGKIVAEKLEYCINKEEKEMMKDKEKFFIYLWHDAFSKDKILRKNKETEKIDNFSEDEIFLNGKGLCRNYVEVNCAVFKVLKDISPKLANTYMRNYSLGFRYGFFHAWNQITTFSGDEQNLEMLVTYVDPTWLDTRKQTELGDGKKMTKLDEETLYDAYDREHFGHNNIYAHIEIADLLCSLGKNQRRASKNYPATNEQIKFYQTKAIEKRIINCHKLLDIGEKKANGEIFYEPYFSYEFQKTIEAMIWSYSKKNEEGKIDRFEKLNEVYKRAVKISPDFAEQKKAYNVYKNKKCSFKEFLDDLKWDLF